MNPREIVIEQIRHRETSPVPYSMSFEAEVGARLTEHFGSGDWYKSVSPYITWCGSVIVPPKENLGNGRFRDAFGTVWRTDELPYVVVEPGLKTPSFQGYDFPSIEAFLNADRTSSVKKRVEEASETFTFVSAALCLWEGWNLRGFENTLMDCAVDEGFFTELLDRMTELCLGWIKECESIPSDAISMGDDWGDQRGTFIGAERWRKFFKPRYARIIQAVHDQGKIAIHHTCGSVAEIMDDIVELGLDVLQSVQPEAAGMNPYELKRQWGDKITFWGCLGSQSTIPFGTPDELREEIRRLRREMSRGGGYILSPAKPVRPETPTENAVALFEEFLNPSGGPV